MTLFTRGNIWWAYAASLVIAALMVLASVGGLVDRVGVYPTEDLRQAFVPSDVVNLGIGLPILLGSLWLARRGRLIGLLGWPGALLFVLYTYIVYVAAMPLGGALVLHLALVTVSAYTLIGLVVAINGVAVREALIGSVPTRVPGAILAGLGLLFFARAVGVIVSAVSTGATLAETELALTISDFVITPAWMIGGVLLWRRSPSGYATGVGPLFQASMLFIALIAFLLLGPVLTPARFVPTDVAVIAAMGLVCVIPFALVARGVMSASNVKPTAAPGPPRAPA